jgi:rare lipoprotein A
MVIGFIKKKKLALVTNIIIWAIIAIIIICNGSCRRRMELKNAKNLQDSILAYSDSNKFNTRLLKIGHASWYGDEWNGQCTACGDTFYNYKFTAASSTIPIGTFLKITNIRNGKVVFVRVNDTFPSWNRRDLDLSEAAAKRLDMIEEGVGKVKIEIITEVKKE